MKGYIWPKLIKEYQIEQVDIEEDAIEELIAEVHSRSMSCNCMTRTSQQECRGILEYVEGNIIKNIKEENLAKIMGPIYYR